MMVRHLCVAATVAMLVTVSMAAADTVNVPTALSQQVQNLRHVSAVSANLPDRAIIDAEDAAIEAAGEAPRFAIPMEVSITPQSGGTWEPVENGEMLWRLRVTSPGALSVNFGFERYFMPEGGRLFVYSADGKFVQGPFTAADNEEHGQLWTPVVLGDDVIVELTIPADRVAELDLELTSINPGYRGFGEQYDKDDPWRVGSCNVDVICPQGDDWRTEIAAVATISRGGSRVCSGFMVNNTAQDLTPYFMTAQHCGVTSSNAPSLVTYWNYENSTCRPVGSAGNGAPGDGPLTMFNTGSIFRAGYGASDVTLVELDDDPNPAWEVGFAGWDRSGVDATSAVAIHHPDVLEKRISFEYQATSTTSYLGTSIPGDGTHVRITDWDLGTTEPGSSGSPVFDQNHRVIGQLHGGYAACGNDDSDWYGKFSVSWTGGGTPSSRLSDWLDPGNTGALFVDSISGAGMTVVPGSGVLHIGLAGGPFNDETVVYTLTNFGPVAVNYTVELTQSFGILLNGDRDPLAGTLAAGGGTADVTVTLGPDIVVLGPGVYVEDIIFTDTTNNRSLVRTHTVEVGQTLFGTTPDNGLSAGGPVGGPFNGTQVYTITSERPTPVTVEIAPGAPWISVNGGNTPVQIVLSGTGQTADVTVGYYAPEANLLVAGIYNSVVEFNNLTDPGRGDTTRPIMLDVGRYTYTSLDVPKPIADNTTVNSTLAVADYFCIGDVDIDVNISHTYIGDLIVTLESPEGTQVRLHNRTGGTTDNLVVTYDDGVRNPDGPGTLADFNGENPVGTWKLIVSDNAGSDTGTLNGWSLRIATAGSHCPPVAQDTAVVVPVCNLTTVNLPALSQIGAGMEYVIQSLPSKGTLYDLETGPITAAPHTLSADTTTVIYRPEPMQTGADSFTFLVDDGLPSNVATASITIDPGARSEQLFWSLDEDPGWTMDTGWAFGVPTGSGSPSKDPTSGYTGSNVLGYNLNGNYTSNMPQRNLTTTAIDCSEYESTQLRFWRWLGVESWDDAKVQVSNDGSNWTTVWDNPTGSGQSIGDSAWIPVEFDISAVADGQPTVYIRWTMGPTDVSGNYPGWNIDDIAIWALRPGYALSYAAMGDCLEGPNVEAAASCACADRDGDLDVDLVDFAILQAE